MKSRDLTKTSIAELDRLCKEHSLEELSQQFNMSKTQIQRWLAEFSFNGTKLTYSYFNENKSLHIKKACGGDQAYNSPIKMPQNLPRDLTEVQIQEAFLQHDSFEKAAQALDTYAEKLNSYLKKKLDRKYPHSVKAYSRKELHPIIRTPHWFSSPTQAKKRKRKASCIAAHNKVFLLPQAESNLDKETISQTKQTITIDSTMASANPPALPSLKKLKLSQEKTDLCDIDISIKELISKLFFSAPSAKKRHMASLSTPADNEENEDIHQYAFIG